MFAKHIAHPSLCECGYPALKEAGTDLYKIPRFNLVGEDDIWICGGCGKERTVHPIMVINSEGLVGFMPMELFDWDQEQKEKFNDTQRIDQAL